MYCIQGVSGKSTYTARIRTGWLVVKNQPDGEVLNVDFTTLKYIIKQILRFTNNFGWLKLNSLNSE